MANEEDPTFQEPRRPTPRTTRLYRIAKGYRADAPPNTFRLRGPQSGQAKLTPSQVAEARDLHLGHRWTCAALARRFKVTRQAMSLLLRGITWKSAGTGGGSSSLKPGLSLSDFEE